MKKRIVGWFKSTPPPMRALRTPVQNTDSYWEERETKITILDCNNGSPVQKPEMQVRTRSEQDTESTMDDASVVGDITIHAEPITTHDDVISDTGSESSEPEADKQMTGSDKISSRLDRELLKLQSIVKNLNALEQEIHDGHHPKTCTTDDVPLDSEQSVHFLSSVSNCGSRDADAGNNMVTSALSDTSPDFRSYSTDGECSGTGSCSLGCCTSDAAGTSCFHSRRVGSGTVDSISSPGSRRATLSKCCKHCKHRRRHRKEYRDVATGSPLRLDNTRDNMENEVDHPVSAQSAVAGRRVGGLARVGGPARGSVSGGSRGPHTLSQAALTPDEDATGSSDSPCHQEADTRTHTQTTTAELLLKMPPKPKSRLAPPSSKLVFTRSPTPIPDARDVKRASIRRVRQESRDGRAAGDDPSAGEAVRRREDPSAGEPRRRVRGVWCENCNSRLVEIKRQAVKLWMPHAVKRGPSQTKDPEFLRHIEDRLLLPERLQRHLHNDTCDICDTSVQDLRQEALRMVHSLERTQAELGPGIMAGRKGVVPLPRTNTHYSPAHHRLVRQGLHATSRRSGSPHGGLQPGSAVTTRGGGGGGIVERGESDRDRIVQERLGHNRTPSPYPKHHSLSGRRPPQNKMLSNGSSPMSAGGRVTGLNGNVPDHGSPVNSQVALSNGALRPTMLPLPNRNHPQYMVNGHPQPSGHPGAHPQPVGHAGAHPQGYAPQSQGYAPHPQAQAQGVGAQFVSPLAATSGGPSNSNAAAAFFVRAAQKLTISSRKKKKSQIPPDPEPPPFPTNFCDVIRMTPPPAPPCLIRAASRLQPPGSGKVKVMLRICPMDTNNTSSWLNLDSRKKQITVYDPSSYSGFTAPSRRAGTVPPKMFAFDAIFSQDDSLAEICSTSLVEIVQAVVNGADGCLFCYGHARLGKTYTMLGVDDSPQNLGVIPCAIAWLFKLINDQKDRTGARFSVRVSAVEVTGKQEKLKDLLADVPCGADSCNSTTPSGVYLREDPICGMTIENQRELRAPTAERASYYLDAAVAARTVPEVEEDARNSHLLFTISVYQYKVEKSTKGQNGVAGGRSRLHLIDLGSCSKSRDCNTGNALSLSALGNVILALLNGQRHVPHRESKLTQLIRESFGNWSCRTCMIAHISPAVHAYNETLQVIQLAARIHRMKRRRNKFSSTSSDDSSCDDQSVRFRSRIRPGVRMGTLREDAICNGVYSHSDPDYSSSELSCDTVIYVGANGRALSDRELTDNEGPPQMIPFIRPPLGNSKLANKSSEDEGEKSTENKSEEFSRVQKLNSLKPGTGTFVSKLPPKSPSRTNHQSAGAQGTGAGGVVQLPRKISSKSKPSLHAKLKGEDGPPVAGSEHWVDGPSAPTYPPASTAPCEPWVYTPGATPDGQYYPGTGVPSSPVVTKPPTGSGEHWVDGPAPQTPQGGRKGAEQWVDGPSAFRVGSQPEPSPRLSQRAHKLWTEMQKQQQENSPAGHVHSSKQGGDRTPKSHRKEIPHYKPKGKPVEALKAKGIPVVGVLDQRTVDQVNADSNTSLSVNPDSRPVSCNSEDMSIDSKECADNSDVGLDTPDQELAEDISDGVLYPVNPFVHDWVIKHSMSLEEGTDKHKDAKRPRKSSQSPSKSAHHGSPRHNVSVDDMAALRAQKTQSPDRYVSSAQSSPRLRRLRKHGLPQQAHPTDRTAAWIMSVQEGTTDKPRVQPLEAQPAPDPTSTTTVIVSSPSVPAPGSESPDPECDQEMPGSPPPDYDSCVEEGIVDCPEIIQVEVEEVRENSSQLEHDSTVDTRTESCRDTDTKTHTGEVIQTDCDKCNIDSESTKKGSRLDVANLLMTNRESIYELQMDEQLETSCGDGTQKTSFGSDDLSACSSGSYENILDSKAPVPLQSTPKSLVLPETDEGILVVEITHEQLSPVLLHGENESGIASGSGGHLSPPSSSDDSDKSPGARKLVRPSSLRRPDGASNPNLTDIEEMSVIKEESYKMEMSFESASTTSKCMTDCVRNPAADGQSPEGDTDTTSSPSKSSKLPVKSSLPSPTKPAVATKPPTPKSSSKSLPPGGKSSDKPAVPPRGTRLTSPCSSTAPSPTKSVSSSPSKSIFFKSSSKDKSTKLPKAGSSSSGSNSPQQEKGGVFSRSSSTKSSKSSKLPSSGGTKDNKVRSLSSPTKSTTSSGKDNKASSRASSKSPSPSKRDKESRLPKFGSKISEVGHRGRHTDSDSGNDSGIVKNDNKFLSPYTKLTRPRVSMHSTSSGHGSDNSSTFSSHLAPKPCSKLQAKLNKTETSSGYESMIRDDSEVTGTSSSNPDSNSESSSGDHSKANKQGKKKDKVGRRSRSAPARTSPESPSTSCVQSPATCRKAPVAPSSKAWVDTRRCPLDLIEPLELKKYDGEDLEKMARRRRDTEFRALEKRRLRVSDLLSRQEALKLEMMEAKSMLMIEKSTWSFDLHVAQHMDRDDPGYLEALEKETSILEKRVDACKSRIMLVTCFDI